MTFDKELLFKPSLPEAEVEIPGKGTVRVRALTRVEVMSLQNVKEGPDWASAVDRKMIALGLVDPVLTEAEVGQWQKASAAGEMEPVGQKITELSGMTEGAGKAAYKEFESDPDGEFRLPPG